MVKKGFDLFKKKRLKVKLVNVNIIFQNTPKEGKCILSILPTIYKCYLQEVERENKVMVETQKSSREIRSFLSTEVLNL